jgi:hypothetical protein
MVPTKICKITLIAGIRSCDSCGSDCTGIKRYVSAGSQEFVQFFKIRIHFMWIQIPGFYAYADPDPAFKKKSDLDPGKT